MTDKEQLAGLVARVARQQTALGLNDSQFVERYGRWIGSSKTWRDRLLAGQFADMKLDRWVQRLTALVTELDGGSVVEEFYALPFTRAYDAQLAILESQRNDRRCLVVLGVTGVGKTVWARRQCAAHPRSTAFVKARLGWRGSPASIAGGIARAIGCREAAGALAAIDAVAEALKGSDLTVFVDDAHEGGIALMKIVKTLIDETPSRFVLLAYPTDWDRMVMANDGAYAEAQQLFGRTLKPVLSAYRRGTGLKDAAAYLRARAGLDGEATECARRLEKLIQRNGNLRLLADAIDEAEAEADETGAALNAGLIRQHVESLCPGLAAPATEKPIEEKRNP